MRRAGNDELEDDYELEEAASGATVVGNASAADLEKAAHHAHGLAVKLRAEGKADQAKKMDFVVEIAKRNAKWKRCNQ